MIRIENIDIWGWQHAIRGMRNPMNSWEKSDSGICGDFSTEYKNGRIGCSHDCPKWSADNYCGYLEHLKKFPYDYYMVGPNDLELMRKLYKAGTEHRKFMRQIMVSMDVIAPLYWWKEADTYKVGTVANSCSTMHKIHAKEFTLDDFSWDQLLNTDCDLFEIEWGRDCKTMVQPQHFLIQYIIPVLNICRKKYLETKDKVYWWQMIQLLPSSYNQRRTLTMNYEVAATIIRQRTGHKLDEWNQFVKVLKGLPYMAEIMGGEKE